MPKARKKIAVVYHSSCPDGFAAAWAAWKKFGARASYHAVAHSQEPLDLRGQEVYFLDLVYKPEVLKQVLKTAKKVVAVDHHVTAKPAVALLPGSLFDIKHSGAVLAWKYFHPSKRMPRLLAHIEDEDLWRFKLADTKAVNARLELLDFDFKQLDKAVQAFEKPALRKKFVEEGKLLAAYRTRMVGRLAGEAAVAVKFQGYRALAVNGARPFTSEIGNLLCRMRPPIAIVWQERRGGVSVSLRSDGSVDVAKIAEKFGGGGHKAAAAFTIPTGTEKPWTYEKKK